MQELRIGSTTIELHDDGLTVTRFADGKRVEAAAHETDEYRARANALGYGDDVDRLSREHEIIHSLLSVWLGLPESPTLRGVADECFWPHWRAEEEAVLAVQRLCKALGLDVVELAHEGR